MICSKCRNHINDQMNFCPYCGMRYGSAVNVVEIADQKSEIEQLSKDKKYDELLDIAIQGNIIAKTYYINHMKNYAQVHRGYNYINVPELHKVQSLSLANNTFASAAYGIFLYDNSEAKIQAWEYEERNKTKAEGIALIKRAAENREVAATTILGEWTSQGINGISKDEFTAYRLIKEATEEFYAPAMYLLGLWHYKGINGASKKEEIGYTWIEKAAFAGDIDARKLILQNDENWFLSELGFSLPQEDIKRLQNISKDVCNPEIDFTNKNDPLEVIQSKLKTCRTVQDYIELYHLIQISSLSETDKKSLSAWLNSMISGLIGIPVADCSTIDPVKLKDDYHRAIELIKKYTYLSHFLYLKDDLKRIGIQFEDIVVNKIMNQASALMRSKFQKEISSGISYNSASTEIEKSGFTFGMLIFAIIIAAATSYFFGTVGIIIGILIIIGGITSWGTTQKNKYIVSTTKEKYQLINALVTYGYTPFEAYQKDNFRYDENIVYINKTPSILDTLPKSELSGLLRDDSVPKVHDNTQGARCPVCGIENKANAKFCKSCGNTFVGELSCKKCGAKVKHDKKFCPSCGTPIK